jgi:hypothetical protein
MNDTVSEGAERLIALGQNEADFYAEWLRGNDGAVLSPFALRGLAHSFGRILAATKPPLAGEVTVKALEWDDRMDRMTAVTLIGTYRVSHDGDEPDEWSFDLNGRLKGFYPTDAAAQDAAQSHFNAAILSALASPPMPGRGVGFDVDKLAQEIRRVDGDSEHRLGAGALAEALMPFLAASRPKEDTHAK